MTAGGAGKIRVKPESYPDAAGVTSGDGSLGKRRELTPWEAYCPSHVRSTRIYSVSDDDGWARTESADAIVPDHRDRDAEDLDADGTVTIPPAGPSRAAARWGPPSGGIFGGILVVFRIRHQGPRARPIRLGRPPR